MPDQLQASRNSLENPTTPATRSYVWVQMPRCNQFVNNPATDPIVLAAGKKSESFGARLITGNAKTGSHFYGSLLRPVRRLASDDGLLHTYCMTLCRCSIGRKLNRGLRQHTSCRVSVGLSILARIITRRDTISR